MTRFHVLNTMADAWYSEMRRSEGSLPRALNSGFQQQHRSRAPAPPQNPSSSRHTFPLTYCPVILPSTTQSCLQRPADCSNRMLPKQLKEHSRMDKMCYTALSCTAQGGKSAGYHTMVSAFSEDLLW